MPRISTASTMAYRLAVLTTRRRQALGPASWLWRGAAAALGLSRHCRALLVLAGDPWDQVDTARHRRHPPAVIAGNPARDDVGSSSRRSVGTGLKPLPISHTAMTISCRASGAMKTPSESPNMLPSGATM